jgi:hypothetical protein
MRKVLAFALMVCFSLCVIGCGDAKKDKDKKPAGPPAAGEKDKEKEKDKPK